MDMRKLVGRNVREARDARGITQEQLAAVSGFSQQYISDLERGHRNPTIVSLYEIAEALAVTPRDLVTPQLAGYRCSTLVKADLRLRNLQNEYRDVVAAAVLGRLIHQTLGRIVGHNEVGDSCVIQLVRGKFDSGSRV